MRVIDNEAMTSMYTKTYQAGEPQYHERDFEAGADFICDDIRLKRGEDLCAAEDIDWREYAIRRTGFSPVIPAKAGT